MLQIMAVDDEVLAEKLTAERADNASKIRASNLAVNQNLETQ